VAHPLKALLGGHAVAHFPTLGKIYGANAALLLSSLCFWEGKGVDPDWSYKSAEDIYNETGLTENEQRSARARLVKCKAIQEERRGIPYRLWYRVNWDTLNAHLAQFGEDGSFKAYEDKRRTNAQPKKPVAPETIEQSSSLDNGNPVLEIIEDSGSIVSDAIQIDPDLPTDELNSQSVKAEWDALPSASNAPMVDNGLNPILPEEVHLFDALNLERRARHYTPFSRFKTTKQREKFRGCVTIFNGSTNRQVDEIIANGRTDIEGVVNALDWRRRKHTKNVPQDTAGAGIVAGDGSFYG
jgi:hypothetical protein